MRKPSSQCEPIADTQLDLLNPNVDALVDEREGSTIDELTASSRQKVQKDPSVLQSVIEKSSEDVANQTQAESVGAQTADLPMPGTEGPAELEEEAEGQGAFNPVTGEINWDCPCLGGMAYGPCGPQFREAFSCFVYSNEEPKGMECIDKFQNMQNCFREHPEHYKGELEDDESLDAELAQEKEELQKEIAERRAAVEAKHEQDREQAQSEKSSNETPSTSAIASAISEKKTAPQKSTASKKTKSDAGNDSTPQPESKTKSHTPEEYSQKKEAAHGASSQTISEPQTKGVDANALPESDSLVPKAAHDATETSSEDSVSVAK